MGLSNLLSNTQTRLQLIVGGKAVISFDCSVREKHSRESPPTEYELEDGAVISDNIVIKPFAISIHGLITDTPLDLIAGLKTSAVFAAANLLKTQVVKVAPNLGVLKNLAPGLALLPALGSTDSPSKSKYEQVLAIQEAKQPISLLTSLKLYPNMWIKSVSVPRDNTTGKGLVFDIELVQLLLVSPVSVNITKYANQNLGPGQAGKGKVAPSPVAQAAQAGAKAGSGFATSAADIIGLPK